ncbi:hypothetical protein KAR91_73405 [Candidatus Pacearchaeota archaeon]|nr:hypothetical protein [Candidatus Pacearchaeota archaeon]
MQEEWSLLVKNARKSKKGLELLLSALEPALLAIARSIVGSSDVDDLVQVSRIKIWKSLNSVNQKQTTTIKGFLIIVATNAMKDELRRLKSLDRVIEDVVMSSNLTPPKPVNPGFSGLLYDYVQYIKQTGNFTGAHRAIADKYGISVWTARGRFHAAVAEFIESRKENKIR